MAPATIYDVAVLGLGGMGSQTLMHLAKSSCRVIGIDQFVPPHTQGSSHGLSRLIRLAYFEQPQYVPLLRQAYELWDDLETAAEQSLFIRCGLLEGGPPDSVLVQGLLSAAKQHGLELPRVQRDDVRQRFPGFSLPDDWLVFFESQAGYLRPERCIETALRMARQHGAQVETRRRVLKIESSGDAIQVITDGANIRAKKLVLTVGPWSPLWKDHIPVPVRLLHKSLLWFDTDSPHHHYPEACPCFLFDADGGYFYGMPAEEGVGLKLARHDGGIPIDGVGEVADDGDEVASVRRFAKRYFAPSLEHVTSKVDCRYSMSPDENFVIGRSPRDDRIHYLAGLSGHGFKFATCLGKVMADWVGREHLPEHARFLMADRFDSV